MVGLGSTEGALSLIPNSDLKELGFGPGRQVVCVCVAGVRGAAWTGSGCLPGHHRDPWGLGTVAKEVGNE